MLTDAQVREFDERGFIKLGKVFSDEECDRLYDDMLRVMHDQTDRKPVLNRNLTNDPTNVVIQIVNIWEASDLFLDLARRPEITVAVAQLCRTDVLRIWHDQVQFKPPREGGPTGWHQDHPLWPTIQPADLISGWVALQDANIDNGCMWMVPGSHKWGNQQRFLGTRDEFTPIHRDPSQLPPDVVIEKVPAPVKKGECHLHHCLTWHGSPQNRTDRPRPAIAVHYMPGHTRYEPIGWHPMEQFVNVPKGAILEGDSFPVVYDNRRRVA
ncbi:phytanoyl-CoA dioxygenase family protein [Candidatus Poribacteria bacterium]|nr:phytanoyl-CoA dioxygenase family protein [Candidatus Poribacteria bacterium]